MSSAVMPIRTFAVLLLLAPAAWAQQAGGLVITTNSVPNGAVNVFYSAGIGSNGTATASWSISGALPPGVSLTGPFGPSATIGGTPTAVGTYNFTATVTDPQRDGERASMGFSINITVPPLMFTTTSPLPPAMVGMNYQFPFAATGGTPGYTFSTALPPPGLQMTTGGVLVGTPTAVSNYNLSVTVTDSLGAHTTVQFGLNVTPALVFGTPSPLPAGIAGVPYSQTISITGGTSPYVFSITDTPPPGVFISPGGVLSGTPTSIGTFPFTVRVVDSLNFVLTKQYTVTFAAAAPLLSVSPPSLAFNGVIGGDTPLPQAISIVSNNGSAIAFALSIDAGAPGTAAPAWIAATPAAGGTPALVLVSVIPSMLQGNAGKATIHITIPRNTSQASIDIPVTFALLGGTPLLQAVPSSLNFGARFAAPGIQQQALIVSNAGGGGAQNFTATVTGNIPGLSVTPSAGQAGNNITALLLIKADSTGLAVGDHHGIVHIAGPNAIDIPVDLFVASAGPILSLGNTGVRFLARQGSGTARPQSIAVLNLGDPGSIVNWTADLLSGSDWLAISNTHGTATPTQPGSLVLTESAAAIGDPAGPRYALVRVSDPNSLNSPQYVAAVLDNRPVSSPALADPSPAGLYFTAKTGPQQVIIYTSSGTPAPFQASTFTNDGAPWLSISPTSGVASTNSPGEVTVSVAPPAAAGIYTGYVNIGMGGALAAVNVTLVVPPGLVTGNVLSGRPLAAGTCTPSKLAMTETGLVNNFSVPAGWPATLIALLNDDCGNAISNGAIVASFSNGDAPVPLRGDETTNTYSATWQPGTVFPSMTISLRASAGTLAPLTQLFTGAVNGNAAAPPVLLSNGTLDIFFNLQTVEALGAGLAPGNVAQVYGSGLGPSLIVAPSIPLPPAIDGTYMLVGQYQAPLYFISDSPIAVEIPFELTPNQQYAAIASVNGALSLPITVTVVPVQPGIAVRPDGTAEAQHLDYSLITAASPAKPGETVIIYLAGMGATNPSVASGAATPPQLVPTVVQPLVTVDGQNAPYTYAGLTPTGIGLYQIDLTIPLSARTGNLNVIVTQNAVISNTAILPVSR